MSKLEDRSTPEVFISYAEGTKAYRILDPMTQRVHTSRDVMFDKGRCWDRTKGIGCGTVATPSDFIVEYVHFVGAGGAGERSSSFGSSAPSILPPLTPPRSPSTG